MGAGKFLESSITSCGAMVQAKPVFWSKENATLPALKSCEALARAARFQACVILPTGTYIRCDAVKLLISMPTELATVTPLCTIA